MMMNDGPMNVRKLMDVLLWLKVFTRIVDPVKDDIYRIQPSKNNLDLGLIKFSEILIYINRGIFRGIFNQMYRPES